MRIGSRVLFGSGALRLDRVLPGLGFDVFAMPSIWMVAAKLSRRYAGRTLDEPASPVIRTARAVATHGGLALRPSCSAIEALAQP
jgi:hypothetical protein